MNPRVQSRTRVVASLVIALAAAAAPAGCGASGSQATVSGSVTVNGQRLESGKIVARPLEPGAGNGSSADVVEGAFRLERVAIGRNVFTFSGSKLTGKSIDGPGGQPEPERANIIPQQVLREGVERTIDGDSVQDFLLEGPV